MILCAECHKVIMQGDRCYQVRYGYWWEEDAQDPGEFEAEEDVAYYHEKCLPKNIG